MVLGGVNKVPNKFYGHTGNKRAIEELDESSIHLSSDREAICMHMEYRAGWMEIKAEADMGIV